MESHVFSDNKDNILTIYLNRPETKNAITLAMYSKINSLLKNAEEDDNINVVIIRGTDDYFTSGNDLNDFAGNLPENENNPIVIFLHTVSTFKKPLFAAVCGDAVGIGTTLLFHCDMVFAAEDARFRMPFIQMGLIPEAGSTLVMPEMIGHRNAFEMLVAEDFFGPEKAKTAGLVNIITEKDSVYATADEYAGKIAKMSPTAVQTTKMLMKKDISNKMTERINEEALIFIKLLKTPETQGYIMKFLTGA